MIDAVTLFVPGDGPLGLDPAALLAAALTALVATNAAPALAIGGGRLAEWVSRGCFWMDPSRRNMNRIGDASIRHQLMVGQTTIGDALVPGMCLFFAAMIGFLTGHPLGLAEFWQGHRNPLIVDPRSYAGLAQAALVAAMLLWAVAASTMPAIGRLFTRATFLLPQTVMRAALPVFVALSGFDLQAALLTVAGVRIAAVPMILLARALAVIGPAGLLWLPFAIVAWGLEILAVSVLGPLHIVLRPHLSDTAEKDGIGSGCLRQIRSRGDMPTLEQCFAGDTLQGACRPG